MIWHGFRMSCFALRCRGRCGQDRRSRQGSFCNLLPLRHSCRVQIGSRLKVRIYDGFYGPCQKIDVFLQGGETALNKCGTPMRYSMDLEGSTSSIRNGMMIRPLFTAFVSSLVT